MEYIERTREKEAAKSFANTSIGAAGKPSTIIEMEEALIECHELWRRSPGMAARPFAGDGPWHLIQGEAGDYGGEGQDGVAQSGAPRTPLRTYEVDRRDMVTGWLQQIADPVDRRIVWLATRQLHKGEGRVPWKALCAWLKYPRTSRGMAWRYCVLLAQMVCRVQGWPMHKARRLVVISSENSESG